MSTKKYKTLIVNGPDGKIVFELVRCPKKDLTGVSSRDASCMMNIGGQIVTFISDSESWWGSSVVWMVTLTGAVYYVCTGMVHSDDSIWDEEVDLSSYMEQHTERRWDDADFKLSTKGA